MDRGACLDYTPTQLLLRKCERRSRVRITTIFAVLVTLWLAMSARPAEAATTAPDFAFDLARAIAQHQSHVQLLLLSKDHQFNGTIKALMRLGASLRYRDPSVGYVRAEVPVQAAFGVLDIPNVEAVAVVKSLSDNLNIYGYSYDASPAPTKAEGWPPVTNDEPLQDFISPLEGLDAVSWRQEHPSFDGRGVVVAVDAIPDLLLPELQTAYDLNGTKVRKFSEIRNIADPADKVDRQWVDMGHVVSVSGTSLSALYGGAHFKLPRAGTFHLGLFWGPLDESVLTTRVAPKQGAPIGVLWDKATGEVWVDGDRTGNFSSYSPVFDYSVRGDIVTVGKEDPSLLVRSTVGLAVQTDPAHDYISLNLGVGSHPTMVAGSIASNKDPHGRVDGVAPGAQLAALPWSWSTQSIAEGLISAFDDRNVDVVVWEMGLPNKSNAFLEKLLVERLLQRHNKPLIASTGDPVSIGALDDLGTAEGVISVGGYESAELYRRNEGLVLSGDDHLHWESAAYGPSTAGELKPDVIAPSGYVANMLATLIFPSREGLVTLPAGYWVGGGASQSTPTGAGAVALLISAAKQEHIPYSASLLRTAIDYGARYLPNYASYEQGNGDIDIAKSWDILKALNGAAPANVDVQAPVNAQNGSVTGTTAGLGLYEREGWHVGQREALFITLTRRSGATLPVSYKARWIGNDGTFTGPTTVSLPLNRTVRYPVTIVANTHGAHSAILSIDDLHSGATVRRMSAMIIVPEDIDAHSHSLTRTVTFEAPLNASFFVRVPAKTMLLHAVTSDDVTLELHDPATTSTYYSDGSGGVQSLEVPRPRPGVWEVDVSSNLLNRPYDPLEPRPMPSASAVVQVSFDSVDTTMHHGQINLRNRGAEEMFSLAPASSAQVYVVAGALKGHQELMREFFVPKDAPYLYMRARSSARGADFVLFHCQSNNICDDLYTGRPVKRLACRSCTAILTDPAPGRWYLLASSVGNGPARTIRVLLAIGDKRLGMSSTADVMAKRPVGYTWTVPVSSWTPPHSMHSVFPAWALLMTDSAGTHAVDYVFGRSIKR